MHLLNEEIKLFLAIKSSIPYDPFKPIKVYEVGGCVRDRIMKKESKDIDILVCNVSIEDLKNSISKIANVVSTTVGESMNVLKTSINGIDFDVSIPRTEVYDGSNTHNGVKTFGNPSLPLEADLSRRDITINSMALDLDSFEFIDPYDGKGDIKHKLIRFVGTPEDRIKEDPLRIVRAIQFSVRFNFSIEPNSSLAIYNHNHLLSNITSERILEEFNKAFLKNCKEDNHMFLNYITNIPFFSSFFGMDLFPIRATIIGDKVISNMVCLFAEGGDYNKLKVDNTTKSVIELARRIKTEDVFEVMWKKEHLFKLVKDSILSLNNDLVPKINTLTNIPLHPNQLAISSEELISIGYVGKDLGNIQKHLCKMVYEGKIRNKKINILFYLSEE